MINPSDQSEFQLKLIKHDVNRDLAILEFVDKRPSSIREIAISSKAPVRDDEVFLLGFPNWSNGRPLTKVKAEISSVFIKSGMSKFEISNSIRMGNSGGPVLNSSCQLVGVAIEGATVSKGNNECVSYSELQALL